MVALPLETCISPSRALKSEDFPHPTSPTTISSCPSSTSRLTRVKAGWLSLLQAKLPFSTLTAA